MKILFWVKERIRDVRAGNWILKNRREHHQRIQGMNGQKGTIFFVFQLASVWNKSESVYHALRDCGEWNVKILHVPDIGVVSGSGEYTYDEYEFVEEDTVIRAWDDEKGWFDVSSEKPAFIFYTRPYDHYLPDCYRSYQTARYTRNCYISYFCAACEMRETMQREFFRNIELFFADGEVSAQMAKEMFPLSCVLGIHRFLNIGFPALDEILDSKQKPNRYFQSQKKYRVMWTPRWCSDEKLGKSTFFDYIENVICFFSESNVYELVFRPHPLLFQNFIGTGEVSKERVDEIKKIFTESDHMYLDESPEYFSTFWASDVLITDLSSFNQEYFITGKPILFTHDDFSMLNHVVADVARSFYCVNSWEQIVERLERLRDGEDELRQERQKMISKHYAELGHAVENIVETIHKV